MNLETLKQKLLAALAWLNVQSPMAEPTQNALRIYQTAKNLLGTDASPNDVAPDFLACAETVWNIVNKALGLRIAGAPITSTKVLYEALLKSSMFESVTLDQADMGDIIISPTGYGTNRSAHGHCGIIAKYGILSNNSEDGKLEENYTKTSWKNYFEARGFPVVCFRAL